MNIFTRLYLVPLAIIIILGALIKFSLETVRMKDAIVWDMPTAYSDSNFQTQAAKAFAVEVEQCTNAELKIIVHSGGSLFKGTEIKRAVQVGLVPIGERLLSSHSSENPLYATDSIPFVASSFPESDLLWRSVKPILTESMSEEGLKLLYSVPWPPTGFYYKTPLSELSQLKRSKFRAYNASTARFAELAHMIPVQIEAAELNQALATSVVESLMASGSTGYDRKVWEQLNYYYDIKAWLPRNYVFVNQEAFEKLSKKNQQCILIASGNTERRATTKSIELTDWYIEQLKRNGIKVTNINKMLRNDLVNIGKKMQQEWLERAGQRGHEIIKNFNTLKNNSSVQKNSKLKL